MSYRLIDSNEIAIKYPEVNEMDCIYVDLPNGLDNEYHYIDAYPKHGRWEKKGISIKGIEKEFCSECKTWSYGRSKAFCPNCGAKMDEE